MMQYTSMGRTAVVSGEECMGVPVSGDCPYVLVVDDNQAITSVIMFTLELEGYTGISISDSKKVLPFLQQIEADITKRMPAVILLDLMMPGVSGYDISAQLAQHPYLAHIPVIIMTADCRVRTASAVPGATDFLSKPFPVDDLLIKLERYLSVV
jgi:CheY-like chemotaxis protein